MTIILMLNFQNVVTVSWLCKQMPLLLGNMLPWHEQGDKRGRMSAYNSLKIQEKKWWGGRWGWDRDRVRETEGGGRGREIVTENGGINVKSSCSISILAVSPKLDINAKAKVKNKNKYNILKMSKDESVWNWASQIWMYISITQASW